MHPALPPFQAPTRPCKGQIGGMSNQGWKICKPCAQRFTHTHTQRCRNAHAHALGADFLFRPSALSQGSWLHVRGHQASCVFGSVNEDTSHSGQRCYATLCDGCLLPFLVFLQHTHFCLKDRSLLSAIPRGEVAGAQELIHVCSHG